MPTPAEARAELERRRAPRGRGAGAPSRRLGERLVPRPAYEAVGAIPLDELEDEELGLANRRARVTEDADRVQMQRDQQDRGIPLGLGPVVRTFSNAITDPTKRARIGENLGSFGDDLSGLGREAMLAMPRSFPTQEEWQEGLRLAGEDFSGVRTDVERAAQAAPGQISRAVADLPDALEPRGPQSYGPTISSAPRWEQEMAARPAAERRLGLRQAMAESQEDDDTGGMNALAADAARAAPPVAGEIGRAITYGPFEDERRLQRELDIARGMGDEELARELTDEGLRQTGWAGLNLAFAPAVVPAAARGVGAVTSRLGDRQAAAVPRRLGDTAGATALTAGALGSSMLMGGEAEAEEGAPELAQVRRDLQALRADMEVIERASRTEEPEDVKAAQRILRREGLYNGRIDGIWLGRTTDANNQFQPQLETDIAGLERREAYLSTRPTEEQLSARHNMPTYAIIGGAVAGHLAHFPGQWINRGANALRARGMNRSATRGSSEQRAASMNAIHARGGASAGQLPFNVSESGQFTPNRNVAPETSLFQPRSPVAPYLSEVDLLLGTAALGEAGITGNIVLPEKERELQEAREALAEARTQENYQRVEDLENEVAQLRAMQRAGLGFLGGQVSRGAGSALLREPTYLRPRPDWAMIQTERAALNRQFRADAQAARNAQTQTTAQTQAVRAEAQARRAQAQAERAEAQERLASARAAHAQAQAARAEAQAETARLRAQERAARERRRRKRPPPRES